jgi:hypothetical protein
MTSCPPVEAWRGVVQSQEVSFEWQPNPTNIPPELIVPPPNSDDEE